MKTTNLLIIGGAVILGGLYLTNKNKKSKADAQAVIDAQAQAKALADAQAQIPKTNTQPVEDLTGHYSTTEATKKALEVVTKWISLLDAIPKEFLTQESRNIIYQKSAEAKYKQNIIDYDKALADAKLKNLPKFTFQNQTFWTANQEDERNGSFGTFNAVPTGGRWDLSAFTNLIANQWVRNPNNIYFDNPFKNRALTREAILDSRIELMKIASMNNPNDPATLGDYIKLVKTQKFSEVYDRLKVVFTQLPKSDVNRLVVLLPKYLMMATDDFSYFQTEYEKNPFTIEEQLYIKDINLEQLLSPPRVNEINLFSQLALNNQDLLKAQANSVNTIAVPTSIIRGI